jgi:hypothetical protein
MLWVLTIALFVLILLGTCSGHVHSVYGNSAFADIVRKEDVTNTNWQDDTDKEFLTTSNVIPNKSIYW